VRDVFRHSVGGTPKMAPTLTVIKRRDKNQNAIRTRIIRHNRKPERNDISRQFELTVKIIPRAACNIIKGVHEQNSTQLGVFVGEGS